MKTKAYSFVRWSTNKQTDKDSFARQTRSAKEWCDENGYELDKTPFIGKGESAYKGKHLKTKNGKALGALARFIQAVEQDDISSGSILCVDSVDRFSRQEILDALEPFTKLLNLGIGIVFTGSPLRTLLTRQRINKEPHLLQFLINDMVRSWLESDEKSRKVKSGMARRLQKIVTGQVKYHRAPKYFTHDGKQYVLNANAKTVQRMAQLIINGASLYSIARDFNQQKIPTLRRDTQWSTTTIRGVLKSRTLVGELFDGTKDYFPHVLDDTTFKQVQSILRQNSSFNRGRNALFVNIWKGLAYCKCGAAMNTINQGKNPATGQPYPDPTKYRYFRCTSKSIGKGCQWHGAIKLTQMETEFFGNFVLKDPRELTADKTASRLLTNKIATVQNEIGIIGKEIEKLLSLKLDAPELKTRIQALDDQRNEKRTELDDLNAELSKLQLAPGQFDDIRELFKATEKELPKRKAGMVKKDFVEYAMTPSEAKLDDAYLRLQQSLRDNAVRNRIKTILPSLIGRVEVDPANRSWVVKNHVGKVVYESLSITVD